MVGRRLIKKKKASSEKLDKIVSDAKQNINEREKGYREQSLKIHPWVCGRQIYCFNMRNRRVDVV